MTAPRDPERRVPVDMWPWTLAAAVTSLVAWRTQVGPVLFAFDQRHGVHLGDVASALVSADWAALATGRARRLRAHRLGRLPRRVQ